jgi:hypothetical protein
MRKYLAEFLYQISPLLVIGVMIWGVWWYFVIFVIFDRFDHESPEFAGIMEEKINDKSIKIKAGGIYGINHGSLIDELCYHPARCKISAVRVKEAILQQPEQLWTLAEIAQRPCRYSDSWNLCGLSGARPEYVIITVEKDRTKFMRLVVASKDLTNQ